MRILHTSDWHLGRTLHGVELVEHQAAFLDHLVEVVRRERVDAVLVAGDVYDRAIPPVGVVDLLTETLVRLTELTRVVLTPGNHDSATRLGFAAPLFRDRLLVRARVEGLASPLELPDAGGGTGALVYALPYLDPDTTRHRLAEPGPDGTDVVPARSHEAVSAAAMRRVRADLERRRSGGPRVPAVVMAHAFVVGGRASESERDIRVGGVDSVPLEVLTGAPDDAADSRPDYLALGHLHGPQRVGPESLPGPLARYSGSPLAYSFSEKDHTKSSVLLELGTDGVTHVELVPAPCPRRLSDVSGTLEELLSPAFDDRERDWVRVAVTDTVRPRELYARVTQRFPHALVVQHRPAVPLTGGPARAVTAARDPLEVAAEFVHEVTGAAPTAAGAGVVRGAEPAPRAAARSA